MNCPDCDSRNAYSTYGTLDIANIEKEIYVCRDCGWKYRITLEDVIREKEEELDGLRKLLENRA